jgi:hypothetical protein
MKYIKTYNENLKLDDDNNVSFGEMSEILEVEYEREDFTTSITIDEDNQDEEDEQDPDLDITQIYDKDSEIGTSISLASYSTSKISTISKSSFDSRLSLMLIESGNPPIIIDTSYLRGIAQQCFSK